MKAVVLASGGLDSSLLMHMMKDKGIEIHPLFINYGQLSVVKEWNALGKICQHLNLDPKKIDISGFGKGIFSGITDENLDIKKHAFLPTRNLLFLTIGSAYSFQISSNKVAIGIIANPIFPDQTKLFLKKAEQAIQEALGVDIKILAPFIELNKLDIYNLALVRNFPIQDIYYCHSGNDKPCKKCIACLEHVETLKLLKQ